MKTLLKISILMVLLISLSAVGQGQLIKRSNFPEEFMQLNSKDEWKKFWDDYGLVRVNSGGAAFTSSPITAENGILTIPFNPGDWGGFGTRDASAMIYSSQPQFTSSEVCIEFSAKFGKNFDWGNSGDGFRGGKFGMGVTVNDVGVGSKPPDWGFQYMTMWRDGGDLDAYIYHMDQSSNYPDKLIFGKVNREEWYKFTIHIGVNDPGQRNGFVEIYVNDKKKFSRKTFRFSQDGKAFWKPSFGTFFGGNNDAWKSRTSSNIQFKDFSFYDGLPGETAVRNQRATLRDEDRRLGQSESGYTFSLAGISKAEVHVYGALGHRIAILKPNSQSSAKTVSWHRRCSNGAPVGAGVYFYQILSANKAISTGRIVVK